MSSTNCTEERAMSFGKKFALPLRIKTGKANQRSGAEPIPPHRLEART